MEEENYSKNQEMEQDNQMKINTNGFAFGLSQVNQIKPKQIKKLDIINLVRSNNIPELKKIIYDLSQENFAENDYFELNKDELKLIQTYQVMIQYMTNSIEQLEFKNEKLTDFIDKQIDYNEAAERVIEKQNKKIKNQQEEISKITENCKNMEFLIKKLGYEKRIKDLGIKPLNDEMNEQ